MQQLHQCNGCVQGDLLITFESICQLAGFQTDVKKSTCAIIALTDVQPCSPPPMYVCSLAALGAKRSYEVDDKDFFWEGCGSSPFPKVAEEVEVQLQRYKTAVDEINRKTGAGGAQEGAYDPDEQIRKNTQHLMSAVSSLPELQEQKKVRWAGHPFHWLNTVWLPYWDTPMAPMLVQNQGFRVGVCTSRASHMKLVRHSWLLWMPEGVGDPGEVQLGHNAVHFLPTDPFNLGGDARGCDRRWSSVG